MIKTHDELIKLHGRKVTCEMYNEKIKDAKIYIGMDTDGNDRVYICQNVQKGLGRYSGDRHGYRYSYCISRPDKRYEENNFGCTNIELVEESRRKTYPFKVYNLDTKKYEKGSFFINDETGEIWKQIVHGLEVCIEPVDFNYRIDWVNE